MGFKVPFGAAVCAFASWFVASPVSSLADGKKDSALVDTVIAGIDHNYSQVRSLQASVQILVNRPAVKEPRVFKSASPEGAQIEVRLEPRKDVHGTLMIQGQNYRFEDQTDGAIKVRLDDVVTEYHAGSKQAWIRRPGDVPPAMFPADPREIGSGPPNRPFSEVLRDEEIVSAASVSADRREVIRVVTKRRGGTVSSYEFDPKTNLLPILSAAFWKDGSYNTVMRVTYQQLDQNSPWFLDTATYRIFPRGIAHSPDDNGWVEEGVLRVTNLHEIDKAIPRTKFLSNIPQGVLIHDAMKAESHVKDNQAGATTLPVWRAWPLLGVSSCCGTVTSGCSGCFDLGFKNDAGNEVYAQVGTNAYNTCTRGGADRCVDNLGLQQCYNNPTATLYTAQGSNNCGNVFTTGSVTISTLQCDSGQPQCP